MGGAALGARVSDGPVPRRSRGSLGVFGGTFDPIHVAHLAVAQEAAEALGLERVVFVPAGQPPHKPGPGDHVVGTDRLAMVELAIAGNDRFAVDRLELDRDGPSYTVDTLEALVARDRGRRRPRRPHADPVGGGVPGLPTWHEPRRVLELARVAVAPRDGYPGAGRRSWTSNSRARATASSFLDGPRLRLSATELRARAAAGRSLRYLVPDAVAAYIDDHALYRNPRRNHES